MSFDEELEDEMLVLCKLVTQTPRAVLAEVEVGRGRSDLWIPKSQIRNAEEVEEEFDLPPTERELDHITVSGWFAEKEGLV